MSVCQGLLYSFNSFEANQFFRFKGAAAVSNVVGSFVSICIRIFLITLLIVKLIDVFSYSTVTVSTSNLYSSEVREQELSPTQTDSPFLLALEVSPTAPTQTLSTISPQVVASTSSTQGAAAVLEDCTLAHWASVPVSFYQEMTGGAVPGSRLLCLPLSFRHRVSIQEETALDITLALQCQGPCASLPYGQVRVRPVLFNRLVNPQNRDDYLVPYLERRRSFLLDTLGSSSALTVLYEIENFAVRTDTSILPFSQYKVETGVVLQQQPVVQYRPNNLTSSVPLRLTFAVNPRTTTYTRSFGKIFDAISLVGGLVPIFMVAFLWLESYAKAHFEMTFIRRMHHDQKDLDYGLFYFVSKFFYSLLGLCCQDRSKWTQTEQFHQMRTTVTHLLDIIYLHRRIDFLERALELLLQDHQLRVLHLMRSRTLREAELNFHRYQMKNNLEKFVTKKKIRALRDRQQRLRRTNEDQPLQAAPGSPPSLQEPGTATNLAQDEGKQRWEGQGGAQRVEQEAGLNEQVSEGGGVEEQLSESQVNETVQQEQLQQLRLAYSSYERLRREAEESSSDYFSLISRKILQTLDQDDRELLDQLETLLHVEDRDRLQSEVRRALAPHRPSAPDRPPAPDPPRRGRIEGEDHLREFFQKRGQSNEEQTRAVREDQQFWDGLFRKLQVPERGS